MLYLFLQLNAPLKGHVPIIYQCEPNYLHCASDTFEKGPVSRKQKKKKYRLHQLDILLIPSICYDEMSNLINDV